MGIESDIQSLEAEVVGDFTRLSEHVRGIVAPLFRMGGYHSIIANTIHAAVMALAQPPSASDNAEQPRDETADSIDPHTGTRVNPPVVLPADTQPVEQTVVTPPLEVAASVSPFSPTAGRNFSDPLAGAA